LEIEPDDADKFNARLIGDLELSAAVVSRRVSRRVRV
jgi:hypothetical protein